MFVADELTCSEYGCYEIEAIYYRIQATLEQTMQERGYLDGAEMATTFNMLRANDLIWSFVQCVAITVVIMLVHTYFGFTASGGPAGVGEAVGGAVRLSMVIAAVEIVFISLAIYGQTGNFNMAG